MIWLRSLGARLWPYIAAVGAVLVGLVAIRQSGKQAGRAEVQQKQTEATAEQRRRINEADTKLAQMDDSDIRRELRKWVRPDDTENR